MDLYHIALFIHLVTLIVAASTTAITKLAVTRRARARTVAEVRDWHGVLTSASKVFPLCLAAFVITGAYMVSVAQIHIATTGFVVAGFVGAGLLLSSGVYLAMKGKELALFLNALAQMGDNQPAPRLVPTPMVRALPTINSGIALAVVFDMVTKPTGMATALGVLVIGIALGAVMGLRGSKQRADAPAVAAS